jgi:hypothetical protein
MAREVHRYRARCSGGEGHGRSLGERCSGSMRRRSRDGREARWRVRKTGCRALAQRKCWPADQRRDGEGGVVDSTVAGSERHCGELSRRYGEMSFFYFFKLLNEQIKYGCLLSYVTAHYRHARYVPSITVL